MVQGLMFSIYFERVGEYARFVLTFNLNRSTEGRGILLYSNSIIVNIPSSYTRVHTRTRSPSNLSSKYYTYRVVKCVIMPDAVDMAALVYPHS
jgi:hypothetical protein